MAAGLGFLAGIRLQDEWPAFIEKTLLQADHPDIDIRGNVSVEVAT